jgi:sulfite exporter TauE/SafE
VTYLLIFTGGLAASLHCVGMCGVFPLALGGPDRRTVLARQALYHFGRLNTLVFLGALAGAAGAVFVAGGSWRLLERLLALAAGTVMILIGLEAFGLGGRVTARAALLTRTLLGGLLGGVMRSRSWAAPLALGVFNAFLPCQLIYAFAARAASTASITEGMLTMLAFGLGTVPALLTVGLGRAWTPALRGRLVPVAGLIVLAFGVLTVIRGLGLQVPLGHIH